MNAEKVEKVRAVRARIVQGWAKRAQAQTAQGDPCLAHDPDACRWCLDGAFRRQATPAFIVEWALGVLRSAEYGYHHFWMFNDSRKTVDEVLAFLDNLIARAEREP